MYDDLKYSLNDWLSGWLKIEGQLPDCGTWAYGGRALHGNPSKYSLKES